MSRRSHYRGQRGARPARIDGAQPAARPTSPEATAGPTRQLEPAPAPRLAVEPAPRETPPVGATTTIDRAAIEAMASGAAGESGSPSTNGHVDQGNGQAAAGSGCTAPQLRRFIKSRAWVPMHELRRRFGINGSEDDVTPVAVDGTTIFVGLPTREGQLLGELLRAGDIGYELSLDPRTPIVIGVYPMRPVPRH